MTQVAFFAEPDLCLPQGPEHAFGPLPSDPTRFRVASMHGATSDPLAIAVADGILSVMAGDDSQLTLVLRPLQQPRSFLPGVKYFVYRGVRADSLLDPGGTSVAPKTTNDLTETIWAAWERAHVLAGVANAGSPPAAILGVELASQLPATAGASKLFDVQAGRPQLKVGRGARIGRFAKEQFSFEIVLDVAGYDLPLAVLTQHDHLIQVANLSANSTEAERLKHWRQKEEVLNYLDPNAFYQSLYSESVYVRTEAGAEDLTGDQLVQRLGAPYHNRHQVYLDLRNEHGRWFDAYGEYGRTVKVGWETAQSLPVHQFNDNDWPLLRISPPDAATISGQDYLDLQVAFPVGDNPTPRLYVSFACLPGTFPRHASGPRAFRELEADASGYTETVALRIPVTNDGGPKPVGTYVRAYYCRGYDWYAQPGNVTGPGLRNANYLDNLFSPTDDVPSDLSAGLTVAIAHDERYIEDWYALPYPVSVVRGVAVDATHALFFAYPKQRGVNPRGINVPRFDLPIIRNDDQANLFTQLGPYLGGLVPQKRERTDESGQKTTYLQLVPAHLRNGPNLMSPHPGEFFAFGITRTELDAVKLLAASGPFVPGFPVCFGFRVRDAGWSANGQRHTTYDVVLRGHAEANDALDIHEIPTGFTVDLVSGRG